LSAETLGNVKFIQEKRLIQRYFDEISKDTNKFCFGIEDTTNALDQGAVSTLIVWENLEHERYVLQNAQTGKEVIKVLSPDQAKDPAAFLEDGTELESRSSEPFVDWLADNYKSFGTTLEFVTNRSQEGAQFVRGFGGIGGLLRYELNFEHFAEPDDDDDDYSESDFGL